MQPVADWVVGLGLGEYGTMALLMLAVIVVGMFLDGDLDLPDPAAGAAPDRAGLPVGPTWFGVVLTMKIAIGQFTPPMAVNLMVSCRIAGVSMESTIPWVIWLVLAMLLATVAVFLMPGIALWLPRTMGL